MSNFDKRAAATWSKDRIREAIADLRSEISRNREEAAEILSEVEKEEDLLRRGSHPQYTAHNEDDGYDRLSAKGERGDRLNRDADELQEDVEFLKSLL